MKKIIETILNHALHLKLDDKKIIEISQFIEFGIVGISNTLISYVTYVICIALGMNYLLASIFGFLLSIVNAFYWNNRYVFKKQQEEKRILWKAFLKTFLAYAGTGLVLHNMLLVFWIQVVSIDEMTAPILNLLITIPLNYLLNKFWAFKR